jgi:hypothetical protein
MRANRHCLFEPACGLLKAKRSLRALFIFKIRHRKRTKALSGSSKKMKIHSSPAPRFAGPRASSHVNNLKFDVKLFGPLMEYASCFGFDFVKQ